MLRENATIVVARNENWQGVVATEPVECGWASEAIFFIRSLGGTGYEGATAIAEISPDGMHWATTGAPVSLPKSESEVAPLPVIHFGNWLRLAVVVPDGGDFVALVTLHLK